MQMISSVFRVLFGFVLACLAGAVLQLAFATPNDVLTDDTDKLSWAGEHILLIATHSAVFSAPFALVAAAIGEWQSIRSWVYYALSGIAIAIAGFIAIYSGETGVSPPVVGAAGARGGELYSIVNNYALAAYLCAGLVGGLAYWLVSGRSAGDPVETEAPAQSGSPDRGRGTSQVPNAHRN
jgi:uncharacterized membrane protein YraQ (UPF0718 family)